MPKTEYCIIYILFLIGAIVYGSWFVAGPITVRHVVTLLMFIICIHVYKGLYTDSIINIYLLFVCCFMVSSVTTGYTTEAIRRLLGYYFVSYVGVFSTYLLIIKYKAEKVFIYTICILGILDAVVTIGQLTMSPFVRDIVSALKLDLSLNDDLENVQLRSDFGLGTVIPGIFGVVANGYYLMMASIVSIVSQTRKYSIGGLLVTTLLIIACFIVQERSSFYLAIIFVLFLLLFISTRRQSKSSRTVAIILTVIGVCYILANGSGWIDSFGTRMSDVESLTGRDRIWENVFEYIEDYPLFAGYDQMMSIYHKDGHNLIMNSYIFGGLLGFIAIMILLVKQFVLIYKKCVIKRKTISLITIIFACSYVAYTANSMFHNASIVYGTLEAWLLWAAFYSMVVRNESCQQYKSL